MATLIGDVFTDSPSRFHNHNMIRTSTIQHHNSHHFHQNPPITRPHEQDVVDSQSRSTPRPTVNASRQGSTPIVGRRDWEDSPIPTANPEKREKQPPLPRSLAGTSGGGGGREGGAARLPSPPSSSSSSSETPSGAIPTDDGTHDNSASSSSASSTSTATTVVPPHTKTIPSPASDSEPRWALDAAHPTMDISTLGDGPSSPIQTQKTIHVRDLAHIQALAKTEILNGAGSSSINDPPLQQMKYEISAMPINDIIEMVAALLTKITTTNDLQHDALNRNAHHLRQAQAQSQSQEGKENMSPLSSSVLAFHGKNVPSISILSYLSRIHKYCPTTYEVFLSLLVYFDRMTERVNDMVLKSEEARRLQPQQQNVPDEDTVMDDYDDDDDDTQSDETDEDLADTDEEVATKGDGRRKGKKKKKKEAEPNVLGGAAQATYFVVDSYNIHRLIIAGVTCSSKFFSDVFYTNSRYAKVGGLPLAELNHLELQFLLLNDFRLAVAVEDLEAYATMLVEFYAREVVVPKAGGQ